MAEIVAVMPPLLQSACSAGQIYTPPGGLRPDGLITPTGACSDPAGVGLFGNTDCQFCQSMAKHPIFVVLLIWLLYHLFVEGD